MPKVSVVIPVYNVEKYIERCARSLFEQTLDNIEYIFIDDYSQDNSINILERVLLEYPNRRPQTTIIRLKQNIGAANVRKKGIFLANGEYIIQCDSDDWVEKETYELMYNMAVSKNLCIVICDIFKSGIYEDKSLKHKDKRSIIFDCLIENMDCGLWNKLVKKEIFYNDIIYPEAHLAEDFALTPQLIYYSKNIKHFNKALYHYCDNPESVTRVVSKEKVLLNVSQQISNVELLITFFQRERFILPEYVVAVMKWRCRFWYFPILHTYEGYKLWKNLYPELNKTFLFYKKIPFRKKVVFLLFYLRLASLRKLLKSLLRYSKTRND